MPSWSQTPSHRSLSAGSSQPSLLSPFRTEVTLTPATLVLARGEEVWQGPHGSTWGLSPAGATSLSLSRLGGPVSLPSRT